MEQQRPYEPWCLQGAPLQKGSKEETFAALAVTYGFTKEVADLFLKRTMVPGSSDLCTGAESTHDRGMWKISWKTTLTALADFQYYFTGERKDRRPSASTGTAFWLEPKLPGKQLIKMEAAKPADAESALTSLRQPAW